MKFNPNIIIVTIAGLGLFIPELSFAAGPFSSGATSLSQDILTILTPVAVIAVMVAGALAWFGRISWVLEMMGALTSFIWFNLFAIGLDSAVLYAFPCIRAAARR